MGSSKKIIVIVGATGNQGSSVAHTFLNLPHWQVRCLTRNPSSDASQALSALGAELVQADLSDQASLSSGFSNATAIFVNTDFWEPYRSPSSEIAGNGEACFEREVSYGKNAAHAAANIPTLERFVYSTLPPHGKLSDGKGSFHSRTKPTIVEYILTQEPELAKKLSLIFLGGYTTNPFIDPKLDPNTGKYTFVLPLSKDVRFPIIDPRSSTGPLVRALIEDEVVGTKLFAYDSYLTIGEVVDLWSSASEQEVVYVQVTAEILFEKFGVSREVFDEHGWASMAKYGYMAGVDGFIEPFQLKNKVQTKSVEDWLKERDWKEVLDSKTAGKS